MLLQTAKSIPPLTIYLGWWEFWIEPYKPERREYSGFLFLSISTILYCVRVIQEWNDGCFFRLPYCVIWLLLSGPYTYSPYVYATVTRTHGRKNVCDALMHACPSTRGEHTRWRSSAQPTHACTHILSQGELVTVWTPGIYIYWAQWVYYEVHWPYFHKYTVTNSVFISFEIKPC